ncbi:MAG: Cysteine sulfinate desulfinase/cysteine desulfurase-like enzyme [Acidobacteria bacterium OLB17]|nr:MAG: Cysteine sulfinate desulfinase/cysteine desulfurase-like enzyme [Acidobacteria bacterium OLB17]
MIDRIYLDNSATTPLDPSVLEAMMPYLTTDFGNASSIHTFGQKAKMAIDKARHQVVSLLNARSPNEIVFTSGGTESNNLAIRGLVEANSRHGRHVILSAIEHPAVEAVCEDLQKQGIELTILPVYDDGIVRLDDVREAVRDDTVLITVMAANNEIGTLQPIREIGQFVRELRDAGRKIWFHTDAVQAVGKIAVNVEEIGCDLLSFSGHKINGPKGVGGLFVRRGVRLHAQNIGGRQERGTRAGTENVAGIVGLGAAAELAASNLDDIDTRIRSIRDRLESRLLESVPDAIPNGDRDRRLPNIANISFSSIEGEALLIALDMQGIAVSTGSACSSGTLEPSPVIRALGHGDDIARGAIRFSLGRQNTAEHIDKLLAVLPPAVERLRSLKPVTQ